MLRIVQLLLCVAAGSELSSCDEKTSMLSLSRNHSKCPTLSEAKVISTFEAGILMGKKWSHSDARDWLCARSHPFQVSAGGQTTWKDVANAMAKVKWDKIQWPDKKANDGKSNFFYGGSIITGLAYTAAFAQSIFSGGEVKWGDFVQGIGTIVGSVLVNLGGLIGPILSAALTFALSLFGGGPSISDMLKKALEELYKEIMKEVKEMFQQQEVEAALQRGKDTMSNLMEIVINIPTNIHSTCLKDPCTEDEIRMNTIRELLEVKKYMEGHFAELWGSSVHCVVNGQRVENPPPECIQFLEQGALFFQFQAAMVHLNTLAQLGAIIPDQYGQNQTVQDFQRQAARYAPYLSWSLETYVGAEAELKCNYDYPGCWGGTAHCSPEPVPGQPPCWIEPCFQQATLIETVEWKEFEDVPCQVGCNPIVYMPFGDYPKESLCEHSHLQGIRPTCSQALLQKIVVEHKRYTNQSFFPLVEAVENFTRPIPDAAKMVKDMVENAKPPAADRNQTFNVTEFCDSLCYGVLQFIKYENKTKDPDAAYEKIHCPELCRGFFKLSNLTAPKTRCECATKICPKMNVLMRGQCQGACNMFPIFPSDDGTNVV